MKGEALRTRPCIRSRTGILELRLRPLHASALLVAKSQLPVDVRRPD
jgi:hypothetical protein